MSIKNLSWIGGVFLAAAAFFFFREQVFLSSAETASGTVTGLIAKYSSSSSSSSLCPLIQFTTSGGQQVEYQGNICTSPPFWQPGDTVEVVYDPKNLDKVQIKNVLSEYLLVLILGLFGGVCLGLWAWLRTPPSALRPA